MEMHINPDKYPPSTANLKDLEDLLKVCQWDWDTSFDEGSDEQSEAYASYCVVQEYLVALRRKIIEIEQDEPKLKKVNALINKYAPEREQVNIDA
jgi:hypothetical protein